MTAVADMEAKLDAFLHRYAEKPVEWGVDDCSAVFVPWLAENGVAVTAPIYHSKEEAHAIIAAHGGLVTTWDAVIDGKLFERYGRPELGDIAVIETRLHGEIGVICAHGGICAWRREEAGFYWLTPRRFVKIWAVTE